jgi:replicative DNA helicase
MINDKLPPQSAEIEESILGSLMLDINCQNFGMSRLFEDMFYKIEHKAVFKAIATLYDSSQGVDIITVIEELKRQNNLELVGGAYGVIKITNSVVSSANIENYILILSENYLKREMINISHDAFTKSLLKYTPTDVFETLFKLKSGLNVTSNLYVLDALFNCFTERI